MDDIFGDEVDDLDILDEENLEPQNVGGETNQEDLDDRNKDDEAEEEKEKKIKPKRVIKNPRVTLNVERLKGPKGLSVLESCFEKVKFKGKGHEEQDLNVLLKTYEYWCHRLFPKFSFEDSIAKIEKLGHKGPIQTHLKKVRSGMIEDDGVDAGFRSDEGAEVDEEAETSTQSATQTMIENIPIELTEEQLETIRRNRAKAEQLRQERLKKIQEKASLSLPKQSMKPALEGSSSNVVEEIVESPGYIINRLQDNETAEDENNSVDENTENNLMALESELHHNTEDSLDVRDNTKNNLVIVNNEPNKKCELNQQSSKETNEGNISESIGEELLEDEEENCNNLVGKLNSVETVNETEDMNVDPDE
ncbi:hypothetical protein WA026_013417 [Henosepilachna vigintioctopunctata]|uniref:TIMELESS-interacting protein n=1 Tax=Henosepilachna vigintioctopunctata TaxID=420089 RepID=A0AAW1V7H6_9CUCU